MKTNYFKEWSGRAIIPTRFEWWIKKLQFWRYREIAKGVLVDLKIKPKHEN